MIQRFRLPHKPVRQRSLTEMSLSDSSPLLSFSVHAMMFEKRHSETMSKPRPLMVFQEVLCWMTPPFAFQEIYTNPSKHKILDTRGSSCVLGFDRISFAAVTMHMSDSNGISSELQGTSTPWHLQIGTERSEKVRRAPRGATIDRNANTLAPPIHHIASRDATPTDMIPRLTHKQRIETKRDHRRMKCLKPEMPIKTEERVGVQPQLRSR